MNVIISNKNQLLLENLGIDIIKEMNGEFEIDEIIIGYNKGFKKYGIKEVFDDIFEKYTAYNELEKIRTTNMGSMFDLYYIIELKDASKEKEMIDEIRCRNGNLTIICGKVEKTPDLYL